VCLQVLGSLDLLAPEAEPIVTALREEAFPMTHTLTLVTPLNSPPNSRQTKLNKYGGQALPCLRCALCWRTRWPTSRASAVSFPGVSL
jgi:hypothetical protein